MPPSQIYIEEDSMGDLKTNWTDSGVPVPGLSGDGVTARGGDPNVDTSGSGAIKDFWPDKDQIASSPEGKESPNNVSGLPTIPSRFEPSGAPPEPPSLQDRNPGTINEK
jgi:hypothetical protein